MRIRIHRGTAEIGGNCIEINASGETVVVDVGRPLTAGTHEAVPLPAIDGISDGSPPPLAVIISHPHLDHYGLAGQLPQDLPVYMGREAAAVVAAAEFFSPMATTVHPSGHLVDGEPFQLGPFRITPFLNDHSAFDAYALLIEADGRRVFYTGDIRGHGRKRRLFERLVAHPPTDVEVLLMEGTHVRADTTHDDVEFDAENALEDRLVDLCRRTTGAVVVLGSAQNLDRLVTVFRAGRRCGRDTVVDLYGATVAAATRPTIPQPGFNGLRVYVPRNQRVAVKRSGEFDRVESIRPHRVFPEELAAAPGRYLFHVPSSTIAELIDADILDRDGVAVWSMWTGYLDSPSGTALRNLLKVHGVPFETLHTSGHASVSDLRRLAASIDPGRLVPIHSEATDRFSSLFANVERHADGDWWEV